MNTSAIFLMFFAIVAVWGGLILAIIHLIKNPDVPLEKLSEEDRADLSEF